MTWHVVISLKLHLMSKKCYSHSSLMKRTLQGLALPSHHSRVPDLILSLVYCLEFRMFINMPVGGLASLKSPRCERVCTQCIVTHSECIPASRPVFLG